MSAIDEARGYERDSLRALPSDRPREAIAYATLSLASEQRTANLIGYWSALTEQPVGQSEKTDRLQALIEQRLGLDAAS